MNTYFARHTATLDVDDATRELLWAERRIAIHYPDAVLGNEWPETDSTSLNPDDYPPNGKKALRALKALAHSGGYVYSEHYPRKAALIGLVEAHSEIELISGTWGNKNGREGRPALLKSLRLKMSRVLEPSQIVVVSVARPKQGTLMKWPGVGQRIENMVEGRTSEALLAGLTPTYQEVMCSDYLRTDSAVAIGLPRLARLLLLGRTMRDVDIVAVASDGSQILAQVTYRTFNASDAKIRKLKEYQGRHCHLIYFCRCDSPAMQDSIHVVPLELVYRDLTSDFVGKKWLAAARCNHDPISDDVIIEPAELTAAKPL